MCLLNVHCTRYLFIKLVQCINFNDTCIYIYIYIYNYITLYYNL